MKRHLFLYLFVFALLVVVYQYVSSKNIIELYERDITGLKEQVQNQDSIIMRLNDENFDFREHCSQKSL